MDNLLFILVMGVAFWFLLVRPQQVRQRKHKAMIDALVAGDQIITIGGLFGTVTDVGDRIRVRVYDGTEIELAPMAIGQVVAPDDDAELEGPETPVELPDDPEADQDR